MGKKAKHAIIEQFMADDINFMFGNPGTVEQGFLDALEDYKDFKYILTMQETIAVAIADGYARKTKKPTLVQLHSGVGLGNGIGMIYQAKRGHAPLIVIAGESGTQYDAMDAQMAADLVAMAKPVCKWATRVVDPKSVLRVLKRAIKIAMTPPLGPVFVCLPMDILDAEITEEITKTTMLITEVAPKEEQLVKAAELLKGAKNPAIIMGDGIVISGANDELDKVAKALGAAVWGADSSEVNMSASNPNFRGLTGHMFGEHSKEIFANNDAILITGTYVFPEVFPMLEGAFAKGTKLVHIDLDGYEIAKNFSVDLGIVADPKASLVLLADILDKNMNAQEKESAKLRNESLLKLKEAETATQLAKDASVKDAFPMYPGRFMEELSKLLPSDAIIFDEALTSSPELTRYVKPDIPGNYFQTRGGSLGVGIPGAIGVKIAAPDKTVVGFTGDGGSMYTIQALWTAAHHKVGAKFVICNNKTYKLLNLNIMQYWKERGIPDHEFPKSFRLDNPVIDFAKLSESMGVPSAKVETPDDIIPAIKKMLETDGPFLIDLMLTDEVAGHKVCKCGQ